MKLNPAIMMEDRSVEFVARACQGRLRGGPPSTLVRRICTDSRTAREGDLFVAVSGDRFNGHDFVKEAIGKRVAAVLVDSSWPGVDDLPCPAILTANSRAALGRLAAVYREAFAIPVVAVAGSNGKTTTKDFLAAVLRAQFNTLASPASFNNDIGVPLTLLSLEKHHRVAVFEAGTNHPGELEPLLRMIRPRYGVFTGVGHEHLEFFKDLEGVAVEEGHLAACLPSDGRLFVNGDSPCLPAIEARCVAAVTRVGLSPDHEWSASQVEISDEGSRFFLASPQAGYEGEFTIQALGKHQVRNALLALAAGAELGVPGDVARKALAACPPSKMRTHLWVSQGVRILDDAYNANLDSMKAALSTLQCLPCSGRRIAVLGDMAELGETSAPAHREVGRQAAASGVHELLVAGQWAEFTMEGAREAGLAQIRSFARVEDLSKALQDTMRPGDVVLIKASRSSGFERVTDQLRTHP